MKRAAPVVTLMIACALGCSKMEPIKLLPNQLPSVEFTSAPAAGSTLGNYSYDLRWAGRDADGRIEYFQYAVDPPTQQDADTLWTHTTLNRRVFTFSTDSLVSGGDAIARGFHTVVLRAVDDRGGASAPAWISFTASTVLPSVRITSPPANRLLSARVGPDFRVSWVGDDPDGLTNRVPASFRYKLFGPSTAPGIITVLLNPDTLISLSAPSFAGWDSLPGTATGVDIHDLVPTFSYLLVVVAIDEAGAFSAPFSLDMNILRLEVSSAAAVGPTLTLTSNYFSLSYGAGGFFSAPNSWFRVEVPADRQMVLSWQGKPASGTFITGYRWAVDLFSIGDETPRSDENRDLSHWSQWHLGTQAILPAVHPATDGATHYFYLEAKDNVGALGLVVLAYTAVLASMERDVLIVDDTRLLRDVRLPGGCVSAPRGTWPTAAELDTFLFARGGKPWKCYPAGTVSAPGIFAGYAFDTLVTYVAGAGLQLSRLSHYRNIVWMLNGDFVLSLDPDQQYPLLRLLSTPTSINPLLTWIGMGGRLWVMGGGIATATQIDYEVPKSGSNIYSSANGELGPGRFMYNFPHWRSEITEQRTNRAVRSARAVGGWPGAPDYSRLPALLEEKSSETDLFPPNRTNPADFYRSNFIGEYLTKPNIVVETDLGTGFTRQTLDTLYETQGGFAGDGRPLMTLYHGSDMPGVLFSGFPLWYFKRSQGIELVDWVLQQYWGLNRTPVPR